MQRNSELGLLGTHCKEKSDLCIPRKETVRPQSQCPHYCICERSVHQQYFLQQIRKTDINRSPKHECRSWERGSAASFLEIFVSSFRYSVFAVYTLITLFPYLNSTLDTLYGTLHTINILTGEPKVSSVLIGFLKNRVLPRSPRDC